MRNLATRPTLILALSVVTGGLLLTWSAIGQEPNGRPAAGSKPARALLRVSTSPAAGRSPSGVRDLDVTRTTLAALMTTHEVLDPALHDGGIAKLAAIAGRADPVSWLAETLVVEAPPRSELLSVSLALPDRAEAARLVNAVVDSFLSNVVDNEQQAHRVRHDELLRSLRRCQDELARKRDESRRQGEARGPQGLTTSGVRGELARADIEDGRKELRQIRTQQATIEAQIERQRKIQTAINPTLQALSASLEDLKARETSLRHEQESAFKLLTQMDEQAAYLQTERDEIALIERRARSLADEVQASEALLNVPAAVRLVSRAR